MALRAAGIRIGSSSSVVGLVLALAASAAAQESQPADALSREELTKLTREVQHEVEQLRGWKFKHEVELDLRSKPQLREFIIKKIEEDYGGGRLERKQAMLRMIGMVPPECDVRRTMLDVLVSQIGGFYDPDTKAFYLLLREGSESNVSIGRILIAHELTHALDDQHVDLEKLMDQATLTEDGELAIGAVVEGSATVLMTRYMTTPPYSTHMDAAEMQSAMVAEMAQMETLVNAPRYFSALVANYICGMQFMLKGAGAEIGSSKLGEKMQQAVTTAARNPPQSSEHILHPEKYWDAAQRDDPVVLAAEDVAAMLRRDDRYVIHQDTIGELLCGLLTLPQDERFDLFLSQMPSSWTNEAATGWGGDRFFLLAAGGSQAEAKQQRKRLRGVWVTAWDTPDDRDEFVEDYQAERELAGRAVEMLGERVAVFFFGFEDAERARLWERLRVELAFRKGDAAWTP